jgi:predicted nucleic acid-binding protein
MRYLIDTNVLLRWSHSDSSDHALCTETISRLVAAGHEPCICAQVLIEFRAVATRPLNVNGLGVSSSEVGAYIGDLRAMFTCLLEPPDMADRWTVVADEYSVIGRQVHDARIVALMYAHRISHVITMNADDFSRYADITPLTPQEVPHQLAM